MKITRQNKVDLCFVLNEEVADLRYRLRNRHYFRDQGGAYQEIRELIARIRAYRLALRGLPTNTKGLRKLARGMLGEKADVRVVRLQDHLWGPRGPRWMARVEPSGVFILRGEIDAIGRTRAEAIRMAAAALVAMGE